MAYNVASLRDDWLRHAYSVYDSPTNPVLTSETILPQEFVGAQPGYEGALLNHGEFCKRGYVAPSGHNDPCMLRYFSALQESADDAAVDVQAAVILDYYSNPTAVGIVCKVPWTGHAEGTVECPAVADMSDGDKVVLPDGDNSITYWVDKTGSYVPGGGYDATNVRLHVQNLVTAVEVANALRALVEGDATINLTTDLPGSATIRFTNRDHDIFIGGTHRTNAAITKVGNFVVSGMAGGENTISVAQGYCMFISNNRVYLARNYHNLYSSPSYNQAAGIALKKWIGLRLTAHRVGDAMRLKGYILTGHTAVDQMFINPAWVQVFDLVHTNGAGPAVAGSAVAGQNLGSFINGTPSYTGKSGFFFYSGGYDNSFGYVSSVRIVRAATL